MDLLDHSPDTPLQKVDHPLFQQQGVELYIKREDLIHPLISGNKWYKLKHNLQYAKQQGFSRLVSFGGAFSNHLHALAFAGQQFGFETIGIIRGELIQPFNPTLTDAQQWGMQFEFLSRAAYRCRHDAEFVAQLVEKYEPCFVIPEGGANQWALKGCADIVAGIDQQLPEYDYLCLPCGTGATLAGVTAAASHNTKVLGFSALKGAVSLGDEISNMIFEFSPDNFTQWQLLDEFHCGGFAKLSPQLVTFMRWWQQQTGIELDPVYTGKMMMGLCELLKRDYFPAGSKIVAVHTGGMQGVRGMQEQMERMLA